MSRSSNDSAYGSWGRRKSGLFALSTLTHSSSDPDAASPKTLKKHKKRSSFGGNVLDHPDIPRDGNESTPKASAKSSTTTAQGSPKPRPRRPSLRITTAKRPPSMFGSLKPSIRGYGETSNDHLEPLSAVTTTATSLRSVDTTMDALPISRAVLVHGVVQTTTGMFRKKKEYLVLTEHSMTRYKSQAKASEYYTSIPNPDGRSPIGKHGQMSSLGSASDLQTLSDNSGDKDGRVLLRQVVAIHRLDDGKPYFAIEVCYLDEDSGQASAMALQFGNPEERTMWLRNIRNAVGVARSQEEHISKTNIEKAARLIERANDYDPANCAVYKVVQRLTPGKSGKPASTDDLSKQNSSVCFLAIGVHKVHIIPNSKSLGRSSSTTLNNMSTQGSFGLLTLIGVRVSGSDDTFELTFRQPLQAPKRLYLASSASHEIAARLHHTENFFAPRVPVSMA